MSYILGTKSDVSTGPKDFRTMGLKDSNYRQVMRKSEDHHRQAQPPRDISLEMFDNQPRAPNV